MNRSDGGASYTGFFSISNGIFSGTAIQINPVRDSNGYYVPFTSGVASGGLGTETVTIAQSSLGAGVSFTYNGHYVERLR